MADYADNYQIAVKAKMLKTLFINYFYIDNIQRRKTA
jgi:hypothetical protein